MELICDFYTDTSYGLINNIKYMYAQLSKYLPPSKSSPIFGGVEVILLDFSICVCVLFGRLIYAVYF